MMIRSLLLAAFLAPVFGFGATLFDPAVSTKVFVNAAENRKQSVLPGQSPDDQSMFHVKWDNAAFRYLEFSFEKAVPLPEFKAGDLDVELYIPEGAAIRKISLRIGDSKGETLQYQITDPQIKTGKQTLRFRLTDSVNNSWGKEKNGKIDFPATANGISIDFGSREGTGELWIGKITFTPAPLDAGEQVLDFTSAPIAIREAATLAQSSAVETIDGKQALRLNWDGSKERTWMEFGLKTPSISIDQFDSARFDVELYVPENLNVKRLNLRFADKSGETFQFAVPLTDAKTGWNLIPVRVSGSGAPNHGSWGGDKNKTFDFPVRITGFSVDYPANSGTGTLALGKVYVSL